MEINNQHIKKNTKSNLRLMAANLICTDKALGLHMKAEFPALLLPTWNGLGRAGTGCHPVSFRAPHRVCEESREMV